MHCDVYKFSQMSDWYVYIARPNYLNDTENDTENLQDWLGVLPNELRAKLGFGVFVMHFDLAKYDKLALADIEQVQEKLTAQGYYVQVPPSEILARQAINNTKALQDKAFD